MAQSAEALKYWCRVVQYCKARPGELCKDERGFPLERAHWGRIPKKKTEPKLSPKLGPCPGCGRPDLRIEICAFCWKCIDSLEQLRPFEPYNPETAPASPYNINVL